MQSVGTNKAIVQTPIIISHRSLRLFHYDLATVNCKTTTHTHTQADFLCGPFHFLALDEDMFPVYKRHGEY